MARSIMYHILCFGDSNTYGYNGETAQRFSYEKRWTGILSRRLGPEYLVVEEGLNGRTTGFVEPDKKYRNPVPYLTPCLLSHMPLDLMIVMLGTNDTKPMFGASAEEISHSMRKLMLRIRNHLYFGGNRCHILLTAPVPMTPQAADCGLDFDRSSVEKSRQLALLYREIATDLRIDFLDAGTANIKLCADGCHFSEEGHMQFAIQMEQMVRQLLCS